MKSGDLVKYKSNAFMGVTPESNGSGVQTQRMMMGSGQGNQMGVMGSLYLVRQDSLVEFPIIGDINLVGKTIKEAELYLEKIFSEFYVDPFIVLGVNTKRIFLFEFFIQKENEIFYYLNSMGNVITNLVPKPSLLSK